VHVSLFNCMLSFTRVDEYKCMLPFAVYIMLQNAISAGKMDLFKQRIPHDGRGHLRVG